MGVPMGHGIELVGNGVLLGEAEPHGREVALQRSEHRRQQPGGRHVLAGSLRQYRGRYDGAEVDRA